MIDYICGKIVELTPTYVVLDNHGIGYQLFISLSAYTFLSTQQEAQVYVYEAIREDAHLLFGFVEKEERSLFLLLISVSGVGANTARVILSSLSVDEIKQAILQENILPLKAVKGIGLKTAQRILIDLKDKISQIGVSSSLPMAKNETIVSEQEEALAALVMLGFQQAAAKKVVASLLKENPLLRIEEIIKQALKLL